MEKKVNRPYQEDFIRAIHSKLNQGVKNQLGVMATGLGKTHTAIQATNHFKTRLWVTHTEELLEQSGSAVLQDIHPELDIQMMIETYGGLSDYLQAVRKNDLFSEMPDNELIAKIGIIKAEAFDISSDIILASAQTLYRRLDKIPQDKFDCVIADEAHLFASRTFEMGLLHFQPQLRLGLTATPTRSDGASLATLFDEIVFQYNLGDGIRDGYLCEIDAYQIQSKLNIDNVKTVGGDFNQKQLQETIDTDDRNQLMVDKYHQYAKGRQNVIFCVDVAHALNVLKKFRENGESAEILVGDVNITPDRKKVVRDFKMGRFTHLINVMIATAGFDHDQIGCITQACPTKSLTKFMQQLGRGTRTLKGVINGLNSPLERIQAIYASGKPNCVFLDIIDSTTKHNLVNTWTLEKGLPAKDRVFTTAAKRNLLHEAQEKRKFEALSKKDKKIDLFKLPKIELSTSLKMKDLATTGQIEWLSKLGYTTEDVTYTKGDANRLISFHSASKAQIGYLKWKGYDVSRGVTIAEAKAAFKEIEEREAKAKQSKLDTEDFPISGL